MRPGARGFLKVVIALVLLIVVLVAFTAWIEFGTIGEGDPISHFMADMDPMGIALFALGVGVLGSSVLWVGIVFLVHFRWPAKSRWRTQDEYIEREGNPAKSRLMSLRFREKLWRIHTEGE